MGRRLAHHVLGRVDRDGAYAERALASVLGRSGAEARERALACELVYGVLRRRGSLDEAVGRHLRLPIKQMPSAAAWALRMGAYQLLYTRVPDHAAVAEAVALASPSRTLRGVVNAVLRRVARGRAELDGCDGEIAAAPWLRAELVAQRGEEAAAAYLRASASEPPVCLRVNLRRADPQAVSARLLDAGVRRVGRPARRPGGRQDPCLWVQGAGPIAALPGWEEGWFSVQDTAATWVGCLLPLPPDGDSARVVDLCAAPGGKATHAAERLGADAQVIAVDDHPGRLGLVAEAAQRLGVADQVRCLAADARCPRSLAAAGVPGGASHVLVDAPCSGLGTLRRHPESAERGPASAALLDDQARLLDAAATLVEPGGHLLYSVCTTSEAEGPAQVEAFVGRHRRFDAAPLPAALAFGRCGRWWRSWTDVHGTDAFFAALLRRR